jgi:voltage-gated potassium channel
MPWGAVLRDVLWRVRSRGFGGGRPLLLILVVILGGAWLFMRAEGVSYFRAVYWAVTTASTVGYGDVVPTTLPARLVAMGMMVLAVPLLGLGLASIASGLVEGRLRSVLGMTGRSFPPGYTLVLDWPPSAQAAVADILRRRRQAVVVADVDHLGQDNPGLHFVHGDPTDEQILASIRPETARVALLCHQRDGDLLAAAIALHRLAPALPLMAAPARASTAQALRELGIAVSFPSGEFLGYVLARGSETPHAGAFLWQLVADDTHQLRERAPGPAEVGRRVDAVRAERAVRDELVLGVCGNAGDLRFDLSSDRVLAADDRLLVLSSMR